MDRRSFLHATASGLLLVGWRANAAALPRVALVFNNGTASETTDSHYDKAFARGLRERGFEEGRNIIVVRLSAEGRYDRFARLMEELVATSVDVIVAVGPGVGAAQRATRTIPIVAVGTDGLVESGAVASLARPGGNVTGLTGEIGGIELYTKRLQLLHEAAPRASRVAFLGSGPAGASQRASLESAGGHLGKPSSGSASAPRRTSRPRLRRSRRRKPMRSTASTFPRHYCSGPTLLSIEMAAVCDPNERRCAVHAASSNRGHDA